MNKAGMSMCVFLHKNKTKTNTPPPSCCCHPLLPHTQAVIDSILIFCLCLFACWNPRTVWGGGAGGDAELYIFGTTVYSCMFIAMMYKVRRRRKGQSRWR